MTGALMIGVRIESFSSSSYPPFHFSVAPSEPAAESQEGYHHHKPAEAKSSGLAPKPCPGAVEFFHSGIMLGSPTGVK